MSKEKYIGESALNGKPGKKLNPMIREGAINFSKLDAELQSIIINAKGNLNSVDITKGTEVLDFGLSSDNSSIDNWHTYQDVAEGMFILVDNKYGQGQSIGILLQYKDSMNYALNQVVISICKLSPTEENFSSHQDGIMFFKCRSWTTLISSGHAGAKNTWSEWHDINERITDDKIKELFN